MPSRFHLPGTGFALIGLCRSRDAITHYTQVKVIGNEINKTGLSVRPETYAGQ